VQKSRNTKNNGKEKFMQMDKPLNEAEWHAVAPLFPDLISKHDLKDLLTIMENGRLSPLLTSREQENLDNLIEGFRIILGKWDEIILED
jgi:hypothetical protein